jgi:hypothetical protein
VEDACPVEVVGPETGKVIKKALNVMFHVSSLIEKIKRYEFRYFWYIMELVTRKSRV